MLGGLATSAVGVRSARAMVRVAVPTPAAQASSMLARARRYVRGRAADEAERDVRLSSPPLTFDGSPAL